MSSSGESLLCSIGVREPSKADPQPSTHRPMFTHLDITASQRLGWKLCVLLSTLMKMSFELPSIWRRNANKLWAVFYPN